jgi:RNA polymerase sigma-70 factor (ECF subfamily)
MSLLTPTANLNHDCFLDRDAGKVDAALSAGASAPDDLAVSPGVLPILESEARRAACRLRSRLSLPLADLDDLKQELLLDLIRRLPAYDPERGSIGAFAGTILRHHASRIAARIRRERNLTGGLVTSLDTPSDDETTFSDHVAEADGLSAWHGQPVTDEGAIVRGLDLDRALAHLEPDERAFYLTCCKCDVTAMVKRGFGARASIYRWLHDIHCVLAACGVAG